MKQSLSFALLLAFHGAATAQAPSPVAELESLKTPPQALSELQLPIESWQTPQGSKVLFVRSNQLPMFDLQVVFDAGGARDDGADGLAQLTMGMLDEGTRKRDAAQVAEGFDAIGAKLSKTVRTSKAEVSLRSLSSASHREQAVNLLAEMLGEPLFDEAKLEKTKNQLISLSARRQDYPHFKAYDQLLEHAFANHPYVTNSYGSAKTINAVTAADLRDFHLRAFSAGNALITLVGDLTSKQAHDIALQLSKALPVGPTLPPLPIPAVFEPEIYHLEHPGSQSLLLFAIPGVSVKHPDAPALALANLILGGPGANSRLVEVLRTQRGLTYGADSQLIQLAENGLWTFSTQVQAKYQDAAMSLLESVLQEYADNGPSEQEFADAKQQLRGSYLLESVSNQQISQVLAHIGFNRLPQDSRQTFIAQIQALTLVELKVALKSHLKLDNLVQISVGPTVDQLELPNVQPTSG
ncbi:MAG: pitrilysin family protein [Pseudomonas sp.]